MNYTYKEKSSSQLLIWRKHLNAENVTIEKLYQEMNVWRVSSVIFSFLLFVSLTESASGANNKHRYVIATQSHPLRVKLRSIPAAPIVHINRSVMVLEPPSDTTLYAKEAVSMKYY